MGGGSGWGTLVNPWLIHANVWQKPLQYCKVISLQLIKIIGKKNKIKIQKKKHILHFALSVDYESFSISSKEKKFLSTVDIMFT